MYTCIYFLLFNSYCKRCPHIYPYNKIIKFTNIPRLYLGYSFMMLRISLNFNSLKFYFPIPDTTKVLASVYFTLKLSEISTIPAISEENFQSFTLLTF